MLIHYRKITTRFYTLLSLLMLLGLTSYAQTVFASGGEAKNVKLTAVGQVVEVKGSVKAVGLDNKVRELKANSPIFPKDTIYTAKDSYAGLRFTDGTLSVMRPDTSIKINTYEYNYSKDPSAPLSPQDHFKVKLGKGGLDINAGRIARGNPDAFQVSTPVGKVNLSQPKANIVYQPQKGMAFKGTGTIQNAKGLQKVLNDTYALVSSASSLPSLVSSAPSFLEGSQLITSTQLLAQEVTQYGEGVSYQETATYEEQVSEEAISQEDSTDEVSTEPGNDDTNAKEEPAAKDEEGAKPEPAAKDEESAKPDSNANEEESAKPESSGGDEESAQPESSGGGEQSAEPESGGGDDSSGDSGGDSGGGDE